MVRDLLTFTHRLLLPLLFPKKKNFFLIPMLTGYSTTYPPFFLTSTDCLVTPLFNGFHYVFTPVIAPGDGGS